MIYWPYINESLLNMICDMEHLSGHLDYDIMKMVSTWCLNASVCALYLKNINNNNK